MAWLDRLHFQSVLPHSGAGKSPPRAGPIVEARSISPAIEAGRRAYLLPIDVGMEFHFCHVDLGPTYIMVLDGSVMGRL
jgi:hypothetical protein